MADKQAKKAPRRAPRRSVSTTLDAIDPNRDYRKRARMAEKSAGGPQQHGVYGKYFEEEAIRDALEANLEDELVACRCGFRNGVVALGQIAKDLAATEGDEDAVETRLNLYRAHGNVTKAADTMLARIIQIEKTIAEIPYIITKTKHTQVQMEKDRALTQKARAEYEILKKGRGGVSVLWNLGFGSGDGRSQND